MYKKARLEVEVEANDTSTSPACSSSSLMQVQIPPSGTMEGGLLSRNPLLIDLILDKVFRYVVGFPKSERRKSWELAEVSKDVRNIRLVCKLWLERVTLIFRKIRPVMNFFKRDISAGVGTGSNLRPGLKDFVDTMKNSSVIPVDSYYIEFQYYHHDNNFVEKVTQMVKDFFERCAPEATELNLQFTGSNIIIDSVTREDFPSISLPKLKKLTFLGFKKSTEFVISLFKAAPNLEEFSFCYKGILGPCRLVCEQIPQTVKVLYMENLDFTDEYLKILTERNLRLSECNLNFNVETCSTESFHDFFKRQSGNLKKLTVNLEHTNFYKDFPVMEKLEELELNANYEKEGLKIQIGLSFPKLHTLDLRGLSKKKMYEELIDSKGVLHSLRKLYVPCKFAHADLISKAVDIFPGITSLHVSGSLDTSKVLRRVFSHFSDIKELTIDLDCEENQDCSTFVDIDAVLSGVPVANYEKILESGDFSKINLEDKQRYPSLLNLCNLKVLTLINPRQSSPTDFAAHFILMKMPLLEEFRPHRVRMTPTYVAQLRGKLKIFQALHICGKGNCTSFCDSINKLPFDLDSSSESESEENISLESEDEEDISFESEDEEDISFESEDGSV